MKKIATRFAALTIAAIMAMQMSAFADDTGSNADHANEPGMPDMAHFVVKNQYKKDLFSDVVKGSWYEAEVKKCFEFGLMSGSGNKKFNPTGNVSLAEAIMMADRVHNIYNGGDGNIAAGGSDWTTAAVNFGSQHALFTSDDFTDGYQRPATRAELAYLLANAIPKSELVAINNVESLPDVDGGVRYNTRILRLFKAGVLTGSDAKGTFHPTSEITRAEAAAIIGRLVVPSTRIAKEFQQY